MRVQDTYKFILNDLINLFFYSFL